LSTFRILVIDPFTPDLDPIERGLAALGPVAIDVPAPGTCWRPLAERADGIIVNLAPIGAEDIAGLERCAVIARLGTGYDNVDVAAARRAGIDVTNVPEYCSDEVAEHVLALMLSWLRYIPQADADMKRGVWDQTGYRPIRRLATRTLGLVGFGKLSRAVATRARALGMRVIAHDPYAAEADGVTLVDLDTVLADSDVLSLHAPLVNATRRMIDSAALDRMKPDALVVNAARGGLIDEAALAEAVCDGRIGGAAIDVFENEPLEPGSALRGHPRILLTPHMAFYSEDSLQDLQEKAARSVADILSGRGSPNVVNRAAA
jgi:D-3-phosphoglycerate dehydrogenase / 2-oxoglutarate reductase